jgi:chloramphenicol O-acetyltransferase type B
VLKARSLAHPTRAPTPTGGPGVAACTLARTGERGARAANLRTMERAQALRILRRLATRARVEMGNAGATDPGTGEVFGALTLEEAVDCGRATVGVHTYGVCTVRVGRGERGRVSIGAYCSIAEGVELLLGGNHRVDWVSTYPFRVVWDLPGALTDGHPRPEPDTEIGSDVWIGTKAMILPGVKIGHGAVIGARAVVTRDVRPYTVVGGVPARELRRRFTDEQIEGLLALRWWEWPEERVRANVDLLSSPDVDALLASVSQ